MKEFLSGLSPEDQHTYRQLKEKFKSSEDLDEKKKLISRVNLLIEKGRLQLQKREEKEN